MTRQWSLRARLFAGALAWSVGLLIVASMALAHSVDHSPQARNVVHAVLQNPLAAVFTTACLAVGVWQIRRALSGLDRIRGSMAALHAGTAARLDGAFPSEVQPLVNDVNALLDEREAAVRRALTTAGNLAHGLKTPLAVLTNEADRARAAGALDIAASIDQQVARMRRQADYHLARARSMAGAAPGAETPLRASVDGLVRVLVRLHDERDLSIEVSIADGLTVPALRSDVDEILGNLLDNACRWATTRVAVCATAANGTVTITIEDDGPGVPQEMWDRVLQRGVRADETGSSGLGLAIARELVELYRGSIELSGSPLGGLRVTVRIG